MTMQDDEELAGYRDIRLEGQRPAETTDRLVQPPRMKKDIAQAVERVTEVRVQRQGPSQRLLCLGKPPRRGLYESQVCMGRRLLGRESHGFLQRLEGGSGIAHLVH